MRLPKERALIVDDNADALESMAAILRLAGYEVMCRYCGNSAIGAATTFYPAVVILDIGLPGMSGYQVANRLREQPAFQNVKILAVTGYGREEDRRRSRFAGFDYHITKPVDPVSLKRIISGQHSTW